MAWAARFYHSKAISKFDSLDSDGPQIKSTVEGRGGIRAAWEMVRKRQVSIYNNVIRREDFKLVPMVGTTNRGGDIAITTLRTSKDLKKLPMKELLGILKVHEIELNKDKGQRKGKFIALKAQRTHKGSSSKAFKVEKSCEDSGEVEQHIEGQDDWIFDLEGNGPTKLSPPLEAQAESLLARPRLGPCKPVVQPGHPGGTPRQQSKATSVPTKTPHHLLGSLQRKSQQG
ncbi:hypothetical protein CR513_48720, partial [Mucuna pruriens]